uniref:Uncharacterized protein n=1 Tax=viral metagenome TaxID=1070528 RepID=A0A6C0HRI6_9ZZZZ
MSKGATNLKLERPNSLSPERSKSPMNKRAKSSSPSSSTSPKAMNLSPTSSSSSSSSSSTCSTQVTNVACPNTYIPRVLTPDELRAFFTECSPEVFYILYVGAHGRHKSRDVDNFKSILLEPIKLNDKRVSIVKLGIAGLTTRSRAPRVGPDFDATRLLMENCYSATPRNKTIAELKLTSDKEGVGNISLLKVEGNTFTEERVYTNDTWQRDKRPLFLSDIYKAFNDLLLAKEGENDKEYGLLYLTACEPRGVSKGEVTSEVPSAERSKRNYEEMMRNTPRGTSLTDEIPFKVREKAIISRMSIESELNQRPLRNALFSNRTNLINQIFEPDETTNKQILDNIKESMEKAYDNLNDTRVVPEVQAVSQIPNSFSTSSQVSSPVSSQVSSPKKTHKAGGFDKFVKYLNLQTRKGRKGHKSRKGRKGHKSQKGIKSRKLYF